MLEGEVFVIFTLLAVGILVMKLLNVLRFGDLYDIQWSIVLFVVGAFSFMFILFMVLTNAGANPEMIAYLWAHILIFVVNFVLFIAEIFINFFHLMPTQPGKEKYGDRGRLLIDRRR